MNILRPCCTATLSSKEVITIYILPGSEWVDLSLLMLASSTMLTLLLLLPCALRFSRALGFKNSPSIRLLLLNLKVLPRHWNCWVNKEKKHIKHIKQTKTGHFTDLKTSLIHSCKIPMHWYTLFHTHLVLYVCKTIFWQAIKSSFIFFKKIKVNTQDNGFYFGIPMHI